MTPAPSPHGHRKVFAALLDCDCQVCTEAREQHDATIRNAERNATLDIINKGKDALYQIMPDGYWDQVLQAKFDVLLWVEEQVRKGDRP